jgi:hypothetical protein
MLFGLAKLDQCQLVFKLLLDPANGLELIIKRVTLPHDALRALLVVPKIGIFGFLVQFSKSPGRGIDVKDASSAAARTA